MHNFKELKVWKAGIELTKVIFQVTRSFPTEERYGLTYQIIRSAISIPSNIAEGCGRISNKDFKHFLTIALGSSFELETQIIIAKEFNYINEEELNDISSQIIEIQKMIYGLQKSLDK
jgi:four helix bundle protein